MPAANGGRSGTQSIERAAVLLRELAARPKFGWGLSDLAARCRLDKGTTHRMLSCLVRERFAVQRANDRHYLPGPLLFELGLALPQYAGLQSMAMKPLQRIAKRYGGVAGLTLRSGEEGVYAARSGQVPVKGMSIEVGDRRPLVMTSGGVSILIGLPAIEGRRVIAANLQQIEALGAARVRLIRQMVRRSTECGYGFNHNNTVRGIMGFGIALCNRDHVPFAALSIAAPVSILDEVDVPTLLGHLGDEGKALERDAALIGVSA
jgi:DNA-binding IclR family transcriptional regulator